MRKMTMMALLGMALVAGVGCQDKAREENETLLQRNKELQSQVGDLQSRLRASQGMQGELASREAKIRELEEKLKSSPQIAGMETTYDAAKGELTVNVPGDVLFDPGVAVLKQSSLATLNKIVDALKKDYAGKPVRVEGHTDTDPIRATKDKWQDNLDLSLNRAAAVSRHLIKAGIPAKELVTSGLGDTHPKATKDKSRRVDIVVVVRTPVNQ